MSTTAGAKVEDYVNKVMTASEEGKIDSPDYLPTDWVYLFSSANDTVLNPGTFYVYEILSIVNSDL